MWRSCSSRSTGVVTRRANPATRTPRTIGIPERAGVLSTGCAGPRAPADTPETCSATGPARALRLSALRQDATFGVTDGTVGAPWTAIANAAGQLLQPAT